MNEKYGYIHKVIHFIASFIHNLWIKLVLLLDVYYTFFVVKHANYR